MTLIVGVRSAVILITIIGTVLAFVRRDPLYTVSQQETITSLMGQLMVLTVSALFVVEPFWRMRTVTALGVAISARARQQVSSVLAGIGSLAALWLAEGIIVGAMVLGTSAVVAPLALIEFSVNSQLIFCAPLLFIGVMIVAVYGFYATVQAWSIRRAERWAAQTD